MENQKPTRKSSWEKINHKLYVFATNQRVVVQQRSQAHQPWAFTFCLSPPSILLAPPNNILIIGPPLAIISPSLKRGGLLLSPKKNKHQTMAIPHFPHLQKPTWIAKALGCSIKGSRFNSRPAMQLRMCFRSSSWLAWSQRQGALPILPGFQICKTTQYSLVLMFYVLNATVTVLKKLHFNRFHLPW